MTWGIKEPDDYIEHTTINGRHHFRLFSPAGVLLDEVACEDKRDSHYVCKDMLRWRNKMGGGSNYADRARHRNKEGHAFDGCHGRVWNKRQLDEERAAHLSSTMTIDKAARFILDSDPVRQQAAEEYIGRLG